MKVIRVHQLADELSITNDALGDFLEGIGEKRSHLAGVSAGAAALAREFFAPKPAEYYVGSLVQEVTIDFIEPAETYADEVTTFEAAHSTAEAFAADPEGVRIEQLPLEQPAPDPDLPPAVGVPQDLPADSIALVSDGGAFRENLLLDPSAAEALRSALKGRQCADACVCPERGELVAVTWPCYQKITVRTDG